MAINLYHRGFKLYSTTDEQKALEKLKQYTHWFSGVEMRRERY